MLALSVLANRFNTGQARAGRLYLRYDALRWRTKRLRPSEIDAIDDRTHPAHEILVTAGG